MVSQALRARVADEIRTTDIGTRATTYDTTQEHAREARRINAKTTTRQMKQVEITLGSCYEEGLKSMVVLLHGAELEFYCRSSCGSTAPRAEVKIYFRAPSSSTAPEER